MLPFKRSQRVGNLIRKEASDIIMNRLKDPRLGFVTITGVEVSDDLKLARIYYSVFNEEEIESTGDALNSSAAYIRTELGRRIKMKFTPQLEFRFDRAPRYGDQMEKLFKEIEGK